MWSQHIAFPRALRNVRLEGPEGEFVAVGEMQQTANWPHGADAPQPQQELVRELTENESTRQTGSDRSPLVAERLCEQVLAKLSDVENRQKQSLLEMKQVAIEVAIAIASRLLMVQIPAGDQNVTEMVNEAVAFFDKPGRLEVFLNPDDLAGLDQSVCAKSFAAHKSVVLQPDLAVERGNCRVESDTYSAVFDWRERLEHWRHDLLQTLTSMADLDGK